MWCIKFALTESDFRERYCIATIIFKVSESLRRVSIMKRHHYTDLIGNILKIGEYFAVKVVKSTGMIDLTYCSIEYTRGTNARHEIRNNIGKCVFQVIGTR